MAIAVMTAAAIASFALAPATTESDGMHGGVGGTAAVFAQGYGYDIYAHDRGGGGGVPIVTQERLVDAHLLPSPLSAPSRGAHLPYHGPWSIFSEEPFSYGIGAQGTGFDTRQPYDSALMRIDPGLFDGGGAPAHGRYLVFGSESDAHILYEYAKQPGAAPASKTAATAASLPLPGGGFYALALMSGDAASALSSRGLTVIADRPLEPHAAHLPHAAAGGAPLPIYGTQDDTGEQGRATAAGGNDAPPDATGIRSMLGLDRADADASKSSAGGGGITVAIVDSGVDFSNPDIRESLARDPETNHPLMLDPDGQGIIITNHTFYAAISNDGVIKNHTGDIPDGFDSVAYVTRDGVFLDIERGGKNTDIAVYNSLYPSVGNAPVFTGTFEHDMRIGDGSRDYIRSQGGAYRLGAIFQTGASGLNPDYPSGIQVVPVIVVDSAVPGTYDTIIPDMSSSWLDYMREPDETPDFDFDFTDETPIILGSGGEFLVYDSDGDGIDDYTVGTAGARVLDVYSVINPNMTSHHADRLHAVNGTLLPALDPDGRFFGIMTDPDGHGTASSATVASAGKMRYDIYNDTEQYSITGAAPDAKILPVKALWLGDAIYGWLWSAGFDNHGARWEFSGAPRADIISNSWGVSSFPNTGFAPGYDMISLVLDALAVPRSLDEDYPGVVMVASSGNSGHGYGTLGSPAAASFGISVGASTNNVFVGYGPFKDQPRFGGTGAAAPAAYGHDDDNNHYGAPAGGSGENNDHASPASDMVTPNTNSGHIVDFSSRGPGVLGDVRPDVVGMGAYGFVPRSMMGAVQDAGTRDPFSLFGGTSMAAPMVAGAAAVLMAEMDARLMDYDPFVIRNILMSTARDMHNDPFTQGAGLADAGAALDYIRGQNGVFAAYNDASYPNILRTLQPALEGADVADSGLGALALPGRGMPMTAWFAGHLEPGMRAGAEFTVDNPGDTAVEVDVLPHALTLVHYSKYAGTTVPHQQDPILNETGVYTPNYVRLADVYDDARLGGLFDDDDGSKYAASLPNDASLLVLNVNFGLSDFMNKSAETYADDIGIASLYLYDWADADNDDEITSAELKLVTRGGSWGTVQEIRISDPATVFEGVPTVGIYPVPDRYSYWTGRNGFNATAIDYVVSASYYAKEPWDAIWPAQRTITIPPHDEAAVDLTLVVHGDAEPGAHQGFVTLRGDGHTANVPVSFVVSVPVHDASDTVVFGGLQNAALGRDAATAPAHRGAPPNPDINASDAEDTDRIPDYGRAPGIMYSNGYVKGAFDMVGRYMAGDWRSHYLDVRDPSITAASVVISWQSPDTSLSAFAADPAGRIIQTNVPPGVFGHFLSWPSVDWLGGTPFSEGGGFYHVAGALADDYDSALGGDGGGGAEGDDAQGSGATHTGTSMIVPINGTGTYVIMTHATLFGGESAVEPMQIAVTFHGDGQGGDGDASGDPPANLPAAGGAAQGHGADATTQGILTGSPHGSPIGDVAAAADAAATADAGGIDTNDRIEHSQNSDVQGGGSAGDGDAVPVSPAEPARIAPESAAGDGFVWGVMAGMAAGAAVGAAVIFAVLRRRAHEGRGGPDGADSGPGEKGSSTTPISVSDHEAVPAGAPARGAIAQTRRI